jgi:hypothetical protein
MAFDPWTAVSECHIFHHHHRRAVNEKPFDSNTSCSGAGGAGRG